MRQMLMKHFGDHINLDESSGDELDKFLSKTENLNKISINPPGVATKGPNIQLFSPPNE